VLRPVVGIARFLLPNSPLLPIPRRPMLSFLAIPAAALPILAAHPAPAQSHTLGINPIRADSGTPALLDSAEYRRLQVRMRRAFPPLFWDAGVTGRVLIRFDVRADGTVNPRTIRVLQSTDFNGAFASAAERAVRPLRFSPATRDGVAVSSTLEATLTFGNPRPQEATFREASDG
jgi:TonB family protein